MDLLLQFPQISVRKGCCLEAGHVQLEFDIYANWRAVGGVLYQYFFCWRRSLAQRRGCAIPLDPCRDRVYSMYSILEPAHLLCEAQAGKNVEKRKQNRERLHCSTFEPTHTQLAKFSLGKS